MQGTTELKVVTYEYPLREDKESLEVKQVSKQMRQVHKMYTLHTHMQKIFPVLFLLAGLAVLYKSEKMEIQAMPVYL
jgi:hypothetical protein